ncbi:receptor-type tyrosine-protein phosphatase S isoform X3 [Nematostella vectensis]|uniref:receptor-type tyrosine-protein phosphatase S isoform X3 n=1 Tax=Nematostella vectensis TaxID=45351 RepID=UPI00207718BE|nr:receptor-type tyrosine-protein phosphatase S isoform X3 [Nematostella vectensis]
MTTLRRLFILCAGMIALCSTTLRGDNCDSQAVGVGTGALPDSSMTASSERDNTTMASNARLNGPRSWCQARKDNRAFLEIDVGTASVVCGVATQGNPLSDSWVESFTIEFSIDRENWTSYGQNESVVEFQANFNRDTPVKGLTKEVIVARYLRFFPMRIHQEGCLRVEIYATSGCFNASINVSDSSMIPDHRFSATSQYNGNYPPSRGRLHSIYSWEPRAKSSTEYLQVDLGAVIVMCAVATQGNEHWPEWSLAYSFNYSKDNVNWHIYQDNGTQTLQGNQDQNTVHKNVLRNTLQAKYVRFYVLQYKGWPTLRVEIYGTKQDCTASLGVETGGRLSLNRMTASGGLAYLGRLYLNNNAWCSSDQNKQQYLQVDFGSVIRLTGLATQGHPAMDKWVSSFAVAYRISSMVQWQAYNTGDTQPFVANTNRNEVISTWLPHPINARFVRLVPQSWLGEICARVDFFGCNNVLRPTVNLLPLKALLATEQESHAIFTCNVTSQPDVTLLWRNASHRDITGAETIATNTNSVNGWTKSLLRVNFEGVSRTLTTFACTRVSSRDRDVTCVTRVYCASFYSPLPGESLVVKSSQLEVTLAVPDAPRIKMSQLTSRSASLSWVYPVPGSNESPLLSVTVQHSLGNATFPPNVTSSDLEGLAPYTNYRVRVCAVSEVGRGLEGVIEFVTLSSLPEKPPLNVTVLAASSTSVQAFWQRPDRINGPILKYIVTYRIPGVGHAPIVVESNQTSATLLHLEKWTKYEITVMVENDIGKSPPSPIVISRTLEDVPSAPPSSFSVKVTSSTSILVTWDLPPQGTHHGLIRGFIIRYGLNNVYREALPITSSGNETRRAQISGLRVFTPYWVWIAAVTVDIGAVSDPVTIVTAQEAPTEPQDLKISIVPPAFHHSSPVLNITWSRPVRMNGVLQKYVVYHRETGAAERRVLLEASRSMCLLDVFGGTSYDVSVSAVTIKEGPRAKFNIRVPDYRPTAAPDKLTITRNNDTSFNVSWKALMRSHSNGRVERYEVLTRRAVSMVAVSHLNTSVTHAVLVDLRVCSRYAVAVRAYTSAGPGPYSADVFEATSESQPPQDITLSSHDQTPITLNWKSPARYSTDQINFFTISYNGSKEYNETFRDHGSVAVPGVTSKFRVTGLIPSTRYQFSVTMNAECGVSAPSPSVTVTTDPQAPLRPALPEVLQRNVSLTSASVTVWPVPDTNGPISSYQLIVVLIIKDQTSFPEDGSTLKDYTSAQRDNLPYYISAEIPTAHVQSPMEFHIGDNRRYGRYLNARLRTRSVYHIYERAVSKIDQELYNGQAALIAEIRQTLGSGGGTDEQTRPSASGNMVLYIVVAVGAIVLVALLIVGLVFFRSHKSNKSEESRHLETDCVSMDKLSVDLDAPQAEENEASFIALEQSAQNSSPSPEHIDPQETQETSAQATEVPIEEFLDYFNRAKSTQFTKLVDEYKQNLPAGQQWQWDAAKNYREKNRYANIIAYDHSRVILEPDSAGDKICDYINASYLHGFDGSSKAYIATQGPVVASFVDFWRMIWQEKSAVIVMLTNLKESEKVKCHQYWPDVSREYGDITVSVHSTEVFADYTKRVLFLAKRSEADKRHVVQLHFTVWPDKGVPQHATAVLGFRKKVNANNPYGSGPIVVHCSAGVGRTGAYIAIDAMLNQAHREKKVDIYKYVEMMRRDRIHMVQTEEQYIFVHMAILEATVCGNTEVPVQDLSRTITKLSAVVPGKGITGFADEFQRLRLVSDSIKEDETNVAKNLQNQNKNRDMEYLPLNSSRVVLFSTKKEADYINASFADAYKERDLFIMTQAPMTQTTVEFWRMVMQYKAGTIVMLNTLEEAGQTYTEYWPTEHPEIYGSILVEPLSKDNYGDFTMRRLKVSSYTEQSHVMVRHFSYFNWPDKSGPANYQSALELMSEVQRSQQQAKNRPIIVQCSNGTTRSGAFCAIYSILERLKIEQVVDVFQVIKVIRIKRPQSVTSLAQYVSCYEMALRYLDTFGDYANFVL